ncbi:MAG TPA: heme exporter protein CcmB [Acidimicrobiia bacterium]|nr:heme exporter protein CcmB [Acidimicrobiia bacterium]
MIHHIAVLLRAHLRDERRAGEVIRVIIPFGVVALLVIPMAVGIDSPLLDRIGPGLFWVVLLLFGTIVAQRQSAALSEARRDLLTLLGVDPAARFAAGSIAGTVLLLGFAAVCAAVTVVLYDPRLAGLPWLAAIVPLACAGLAMVGTITSAVSGGIGNRSSLAPLLVVPVSVPILLAAAQATEGLRVGAGILRWVLLLAAVDVVLAMAGVLTARPLEDT